MSKDLTSERVKNALKEIIRAKGFRYDDAAKALKVSLPTMRRWMSKGDLTLSQLSEFAQWLDLDLFELLDIAKRGTKKSAQFTDEQEKFFAGNPKAIIIFRMLARGASLDEIEKHLGLTSVQLQKQLLTLEKNDLINFYRNKTAKVRTVGPYQWKKDGPLEKAYLQKIVKATADQVFQRAQQSTKDDLETFEVLFRPFELWLQPKMQRQFFKELSEIVDKYHSVSKIEIAIDGRHESREVTGMLLGDAFSIWPKILPQ